MNEAERQRTGRDVSRREFLATVGASAVAANAARGMLDPERPKSRSAPVVYDERGGLFIDARVNGRDPVRLILDTGASRSALASAYAAKLGLELRDGGEVEGSAGRVNVRAALVNVGVPGIGVIRIEPTVYDFGSYDPKCMGILGYELLSREPFQLRYHDRQIVWGAAPPKDTLSMTHDTRIPRIAVIVNGSPLDLRIDTGATLAPSEDAYVNLTMDQAERIGVAGKPAMVWSATGTGGEALSLPVHKLDSLRIGARDLSRPFAIVQPRVGYFARPEAVGFLGNSVLDKLAPFLDYAGGRFGAGR